MSQSPLAPPAPPPPGVSFTAPLKGAPAVGLPPITLEKGQSLYVHLTYNSCACGTDLAEMYVGTREKHDKLVATAEILNPCCNYLCHLCCFSCCFPTQLEVHDPSGAHVGHIQLGRKRACGCCCLPHMDVMFNNSPIGTLTTMCCCCNTCRKELIRDGASVYSSQKCIKSKVLNCFLPGCYAIYRTFFKNRTTVEYYSMTANGTEPTFEIINVAFPEL